MADSEQGAGLRALGTLQLFPVGFYASIPFQDHSGIILDFSEKLQKWPKDVSKC